MKNNSYFCYCILFVVLTGMNAKEGPAQPQKAECLVHRRILASELYSIFPPVSHLDHDFPLF